MAQGIRYAAEIYVTSDSLDANACIRIRAKSPIQELPGDVDFSKAMLAFGQPIARFAQHADDWRLMTDNEIEEYNHDD